MIIYDMNGRSVYSSNIITEQVRIPIHDDMVPGIYFISIVNAQENLTQKIFIQ